MDEYLEHYGTPRHSGRYPWGSGKDPYQKSVALKKYVDQLRKEGISEKDIAEGLGFKSVKQFRSYVTISNAEIKKQQYLEAVKLKEKGYSNQAIGEHLKPPMTEGSVRNLLNPANKAKAEVVENIATMLKEGIEKGKIIDLGEGTEAHLQVSATKLEAAVELLKTQGYQVYNYDQRQQATGKYTKMKVLCPPDMTYQEMYKNRDKVGIPDDWTPDEGYTINRPQYPVLLDRNRIFVRYKEDGGEDLDGSIELRPGVADISLGNTSYAQVRIGVEGKMYMKGMAGYSDSVPEGYDIVYNTNKAKGTEDDKVFKPMKEDPLDPDNFFGAAIKQSTYHDSDGNEHLSAINKVGSGDKANEEGKWDTWQRKLPAQFLAKQPIPFAKKQLKLLYDSKEEEFEELKQLTNPVVKRQLLMDLADSCDSLSVSMEAAALPRQATKVLRPVPELKDDEIYAPTFKPGEQVALVRFPHAGTFEIPVLTVNNEDPHGKVRVGPSARDAVGVNSNVAAHLSGADYDGDTVLVIPMSSQKVKTTKPLFSNFDTKQFKLPEGQSNGMTDATKQTQMGKISNLITDMTIGGASADKMERAVKHSMVVIDAQKHNLDWKASYTQYGIKELEQEYQLKPSGRAGGASTLLSAGTGKQHYETYREKVDWETGKKYREDKPEDTYVSKKTGQVTRRTVERPRLAMIDDAFELSSGSAIEEVYAEHSNSLKRLAEAIRREVGGTKNIPLSPSAKKTYAPEVASLNAKLGEVMKNKPKERAAQAIADSMVSAQIKADPTIKDDRSKEQKIRNQAQARARARTGAKRSEIFITDREWEAIQAGAISSTSLAKILTRSDKGRVKELATPKNTKILTPAVAERIQRMIDNGCTLEQAATQVGVSIATVNRALDM